MDITCERVGRNLIVRIAGEIDHHSSGEVRSRIDGEYERSGASNILIDFGNVGFIDSSGVGVLIGRYKMLEARGSGRLVFFGADRHVSRLFDITGLSRIIKSADSLEQAVRITEGGAA